MQKNNSNYMHSNAALLMEFACTKIRKYQLNLFNEDITKVFSNTELKEINRLEPHVIAKYFPQREYVSVCQTDLRFDENLVQYFENEFVIDTFLNGEPFKMVSWLSVVKRSNVS